MCRITRQRIVLGKAAGKESTETVYAISSLTPEQARAERLLALSRDHWDIENTLHDVRDVTCREDQARTNAGNAPQVMAALRNTALTLVRRQGSKPVEGFEYFAENRTEAITMVLRRRTE